MIIKDDVVGILLWVDIVFRGVDIVVVEMVIVEGGWEEGIVVGSVDVEVSIWELIEDVEVGGLACVT
ncbi:hypothetical protein, partial [Paenibacillus sp. Y412MC10]|uniref:hypothetical protein n=1 Tax=Geobacillus sp. (strain Y412MC10) TaxID=481743 RepID=UPI0011A381C0